MAYPRRSRTYSPLPVAAPVDVPDRPAGPAPARCVAVPAGNLVLPVIGSANRDPAALLDAGRVGVARDPNPHLAFGAAATLQHQSRLWHHEFNYPSLFF